MGRFLKNILLFATPFVLLFAACELSVSCLRSKLLSGANLDRALKGVENEYAWMNKIHHPHKVLLLGSSSVRYGLSCTLLDSLSHDSLCFLNLGMDARDPVETYFLLRHTDLAGVKAMYYGLDSWIFTKRYYMYRNTLLYADDDLPTAAKFFAEYDNDIFRKRMNNLYCYCTGTPYTNDYPAAPQYTIPADYGTAILKQYPTNFNDVFKDQFQAGKYGWSDLQFTYLVKIVQLCTEHNIAFSAFLPPKRTDFCNYYRDGLARQQQEFVQRLVAVHFSAPMYGTYDQLRNDNDSSLFVESFHLNAHGQQVYSRIFYSFVCCAPMVPFSAGYSFMK